MGQWSHTRKFATLTSGIYVKWFTSAIVNGHFALLWGELPAPVASFYIPGRQVTERILCR